ncbi:hypothetical protein BTA51_07080 [Hahella sp. CCB-MM4]|uniref:DUF6174 domain-containing protein n=1 Tax=Hahella sp. (strain CCB-MM4) TaxID=1926491 RepID=UPI000B9C38EF|nr:DUF6174 domain-containing protein [Hahella sp. CCB-MM4]OZG74729.1 hypothetical protein BTA51_07080 [Hahella sp. CCB-MM4]
MRIILLLLAFVLLASCCQSGESKIEEMVVAKNQWQIISYGKNYRFELESRMGRTHLVKTFVVVPGSLNNNQDGEFATINDLFTFAFNSLKDTEAVVEVVYDDQYGYPSSVTVNRKNQVDGNSFVTVKDLEFLEDTSDKSE